MLYLLFSALIVIADQIVKRWAVLNLKGRVLKISFPESLTCIMPKIPELHLAYLEISADIYHSIYTCITRYGLHRPFKTHRLSLGLVPLSMVLGGRLEI